MKKRKKMKDLNFGPIDGVETDFENVNVSFKSWILLYKEKGMQKNENWKQNARIISKSSLRHNIKSLHMVL